MLFKVAIKTSLTEIRKPNKKQTGAFRTVVYPAALNISRSDSVIYTLAGVDEMIGAWASVQTTPLSSLEVFTALLRCSIVVYSCLNTHTSSVWSVRATQLGSKAELESRIKTGGEPEPEVALKRSHFGISCYSEGKQELYFLLQTLVLPWFMGEGVYEMKCVSFRLKLMRRWGRIHEYISCHHVYGQCGCCCFFQLKETHCFTGHWFYSIQFIFVNVL